MCIRLTVRKCTYKRSNIRRDELISVNLGGIEFNFPSMCLCVLVMTVSPVKTAEPIEMPLEVDLASVQRIMHGGMLQSPLPTNIERSVLSSDGGCR